MSFLCVSYQPSTPIGLKIIVVKKYSFLGIKIADLNIRLEVVRITRIT
jgi:hypothetical protein